MASHGCIRMHNRDVELLYPWVKHNTEVIIVGNPLGVYLIINEPYLEEPGSDVVALQEKLILLGFLEGRPMVSLVMQRKNAVKAFQKQNNLKVTGQVGWTEYERLNL